jgi:hypothetical protein
LWLWEINRGLEGLLEFTWFLSSFLSSFFPVSYFDIFLLFFYFLWDFPFILKKYVLPRVFFFSGFVQYSFLWGFFVFELNINIKYFWCFVSIAFEITLASTLRPLDHKSTLWVSILSIKWYILILIFLIFFWFKYDTYPLDFYFLFWFFCEFVALGIFYFTLQFNIWWYLRFWHLMFWFLIFILSYFIKF